MTPYHKDMLKLLVATIAIILLLWFVYRPAPRPTPLSDFEVTDAWLQCSDCQGPYLGRIKASSNKTKDSLTRILESALLFGPDSQRMARVEEDLKRVWNADSLYRFSGGKPGHGISLGPGLTIDTTVAPDSRQNLFLTRYRKGFQIRWQARAAIALGVIRTPPALQALDSAEHLIIVHDRLDNALLRTIRIAKSDSGIVALRHYPYP